jgi:hypothetical protein
MSSRSNLERDLWTFTAVGETTMTDTSNFAWIVITVITTGFTGDINFYASNQKALKDFRPDLSTAASATNEYSTVAVIDAENAGGIDGDTGLPLAAETSVKRYHINDSNTNWVWLKVSWIVSWSVTLKIDATDNQ